MVIAWNKSNRRSPAVIMDNFVAYRLFGWNLASVIRTTEYPYLPSLARLLREISPDIVQIQSHIFLTSIQAVMAASRLGIPCVVTVHGVSARRGLLLNLAQSLYLNSIARLCFHKATKIICLTKSDCEEISRYCKTVDKISVIPNAVDPDSFRYEVASNNQLVFWAGRFVPEKGLDTFVQAAKIVHDSMPDVYFKMVGDGPLRPKIEKLIHQFGLRKNFILTGIVGRNEVAKLLTEPLIFLLTSRKEGLPTALLEAMSAGKAVVATNIPGVNEVVLDGINGVLAKADDPEDLAKKVLMLLQDVELARRLGASARQSIQTRYSWNSVIDRIENLYENAITHFNSRCVLQ